MKSSMLLYSLPLLLLISLSFNYYIIVHILPGLPILGTPYSQPLHINISSLQPLTNTCHQHDKKILLNMKNIMGKPTSLTSWDTTTDCCLQWHGIRCDEHGHVVSLHISNIDEYHHSHIPPLLNELSWLTELYFTDSPGLFGLIPSSISKLTNLTKFVIFRTNVSGPVPNFLGQLTKLKVLDLSGIKLTGPIPIFLKRLKSLDHLDLSSNRLMGPIPDYLSQLKSLTYLDLSNNKLTGPIPIGLAQLKNLIVLSLGSNKLSGQIPEFLGRELKSISTLKLETNNFSGPIPTSLGQPSNLTTIFLSDNQLIGLIPKSLGSIYRDKLALDNNKLTGDASFLFDVSQLSINNNLLKFDFSNVNLGLLLWSFNISHNMIYGSLPEWFGQIDFMYHVDVSYNQLCGPIPNGQRFKQVDPLKFAHNKCLCGGPLPACKRWWMLS